MTTIAIPRRRALRKVPAGRYLILCVCAVLFGYPLLWLIFGSLKGESEFFTNLFGPPTTPLWENFASAWTVSHVGQYATNSLFVTGVTTVGVVAVTFPLSYAVARIKFRGWAVVLGFFAVCLFVPLHLAVIPLFSLEVSLGLYNTLLGLILPYVALSMPFSVLFLSSYLMTVPRELEEAAAIDGAGRVRTMFFIMLPMCRSAIATVVIFTVMGIWNELFFAQALITSPELRTLPLGLLNIQVGVGGATYPELFSAITISLAPILIVFLLTQKSFIRDLMAGAVKL